MRALDFDGVNDFIDFNNIATPLIPATTNFSLSMWVYLPAVTDEWFFNQYIAATGNGRLLLRALGGYISLFLGNKGALSTVLVTGTTPISVNTWVHVVAIRSGNTFEVWVNGSLDATHTDGSSRSILQTGNTMFGGSTNTSQYNSGSMKFDGGRFDDLRIFNTALDSSDVSYLYNSGTGRGVVASATIRRQQRSQQIIS